MKTPIEKRLAHGAIVFWANNSRVVKIAIAILFYSLLWAIAYGNGTLFVFDENTPAAVAIEQEFTRLGGVIMAVSLFNKIVKI